MSDTPQSTAPYLQPRRYGPRILALLLVLAICLWLAGFVRFIQTLPRQVADQERQTDAIVVLTGGAARVDIGLNLLAHGQARAHAQGGSRCAVLVISRATRSARFWPHVGRL